MTTHVGKIGRLAKHIRQDIGERIEDGQSGKEIVQWLNSLQSVKDLCAAAFEGRAITEQNLSEWKQTGHLVWLRREEMRRVAEGLTEQSDDLDEAADGIDIGDRLGKVLAAEMTRLALALLEEETDLKKKWQLLCEVRRELSALRRDDHRAERVAIRREQWDHKLEQEAEAVVERHDERRKERMIDSLLLPALDAPGGKVGEAIHRIRYGLPLGDLLKGKPRGKSGPEGAENPSKNEKIQANPT